MRVAEFQEPHRRVVVAVDMESYSKRNNILQHRAQLAFREIMTEATTEVGLDRVDWVIQQGGDGELAILPPQTSERTVVARLAPVADRLLRAHNQGLTAEGKVRLRIAVHQGLVHLDGANGFPSAAVVHVCRLVDSPQLKAALRDHPGADVALIVSDELYQDVVQQYRDPRPEQFAKVSAEIPEKNFRTTAWIYLPGESPAAQTTARPESTPPAPPVGGQTFSGITTHGAAQFGNGNNMWNTHG
jgi:hypothetical protein